MRDHYVIFLTARPVWHRERTLRHIQEMTGWQPQEALFNPDARMQAHVWKGIALETKIWPKHGKDAEYLALESNRLTHAMYTAHGIPWAKVYPGDRWDALPEVQPKVVQVQGTLF